MNKTVMSEMCRVYNEDTRQLDFKASEPVSKRTAIAIMRKAVDGGYNEFTADCLKPLPADAQITLAREGSVCIYFTTNEKINMITLLHKMKADEFYKQDDGSFWVRWD